MSLLVQVESEDLNQCKTFQLFQIILQIGASLRDVIATTFGHMGRLSGWVVTDLRVTMNI